MSISIAVINKGDIVDVDIFDEVCKKIVINGHFHTGEERSTAICIDRDIDDRDVGMIRIKNQADDTYLQQDELQEGDIIHYSFTPPKFIKIFNSNEE